MLLSEKGFILTLVKEHFHKATDGDGSLVWESVKGLDIQDAEKAIVDHRLEKGAVAYRPDVRRISQLGHANRNERLRQNYRHEKVVEFVQRQARQNGDSRFEGEPVAALLLHFSEAWGVVKDQQGTSEYGTTGARAYILSHARKAFTEIGMDEKAAIDHARQCVELAAGETITMNPLFKGQEDVMQPQKPFDAIKQLATAEAVNPTATVLSKAG